jgi:hypothetical protein
MKIIIWIIIFVAGFGGLLAFCHYQENPSSHFSNYKEAKALGIIDRGWIHRY